MVFGVMVARLWSDSAVTLLRLSELLLPGSYQYLDPDDPKAGVKILYGGGSMCSGDIPGLVYSTWYVKYLRQ